MSTSKNGLDAFERSLRDGLEQFEVPYNSADWTQMDRALSGGDRGWWTSAAGLAAMIGGLLVAGAGVWYASQDAKPGTTGTINEQPSVVAPTAVVETLTNGAVVPDELTASRSERHSVADKAPQQQKATSAEMAGSVDKVGAKRTGMDPGAATPTTASASAVKAATPNTPPAAPNNSAMIFRSSVTEGCPGTSVDFKVTNMPEDGIYLWNFGDGSFSNQANPEHTFTKPGRYQVMLSMSAAGVGTIENKPSSDVIEIHEAPMAAFNILKQEYDGHLPSVHFENRSLAGKNYHWDFGDGQSSDIPHPDHVYKKKGVYQVELTVMNETGCEDKIMKDVRIDKDYNLDAPAVFSPNGDDFQETFMPEALRTLGVKFNLMIYSSNGTLLYQTNDATKPWTGRPQNRGTVCGNGEYVWVVDVRETLHLAETYTGKVKLER